MKQLVLTFVLLCGVAFAQGSYDDPLNKPMDKEETVGFLIVVLLLLVGVIWAFVSNSRRMRLQDDYYKRMINKMKQEEKSKF